ncbi:MAG: hypothetical protein HamCj_21540 [Candidatus Hamiltonella defensa (Ceratovacuna japonica)]
MVVVGVDRERIRKNEEKQKLPGASEWPQPPTPPCQGGALRLADGRAYQHFPYQRERILERAARATGKEKNGISTKNAIFKTGTPTIEMVKFNRTVFILKFFSKFLPDDHYF